VSVWVVGRGQTQEERDNITTQPYRQLVGALFWFALGTRPDIAFED